VTGNGVGEGFVHLHVHTDYSMLDGATRISQLVAEAARQEMPALAITDHGNLFGAYDFYKQSKAAGIKPIIGIEAYVAPGSRFEKRKVQWAEGGEDDVSGGGAYTHLTLLAKDNIGLGNLFKLASLASLEGQYYKPRMDRELLAQYSQGIIATSGCAGGEVATRLRIGQYEEAKKTAAEYREIFGPENYYIEIMDHGIEIERRVTPGLLKIAKELKIPLVATNDLHYTFENDAASHEVLLCIQSGATMADPKRFKFDGEGYFLKSADAMRRLFAEFPEACDNTLLIAEQCDTSFREGENLMPRFPVPQGETEDSWLVKETERGLQQRFKGKVPQSHIAQSKYELDVICQMGFPAYMLVVADLVRHAKENGIRVGPGRGSAAGSVVAWALGITELDPIKFGLVFERFLNPERVSMPDIDLDFDERRRGDMIRYATERYGEAHVAQIITYGTIKAKQAIKDSARVLGYPYASGEKLTKALPPSVMGKDIPLSGIFDPDHERYKEASEFRQVFDTDPDSKRIIETAMGIEGLKRQWGVHAAGVILSAEPLLDVIPIQRREADGAIITQFDMGACEALGLLKMDFLGLRNLSVLDEAIINIKNNRDITVVMEEVPLDDVKTYEMLSRADTLGVFQLDGGPMRALLRSMAPDSFEDIAAVGALYRPGPMGANAHYDYADRKNKRKPVQAIHPELREPLSEILGTTYGVIVYQEQVMAIAQKLAGYTPGGADLLRRAMGKKKKEILDKEYIPFADGMRANGFGDGAIKTLWDVLVPFSDYAFNRAHAAAYGLISYWTAYLKANFPAEYMAALLTSVKDDKDRIAVYLNECRRMGIKVLPPDVNESDAEFTPRGTDILFGLTAIRNVGENVVGSLLETRRSKGRFVSFHDFLEKVDAVVCTRKTIESLIKAGAFDSLGHTRRGLTAIHAESIDAVMEIKRAQAVGQFDLFGGATAPVPASIPGDPDTPIGEWEKSLLLAYEREMLGLYVSDHPLLGIEHVLTQHTDRPISALFGDDVSDGQILTIGGLITGIQRKVSRRGEPWAIVTVEDLEGALEVLFFPAAYSAHATSLAEDVVITVKGRLDRREETPRFMALEMSLPDVSQAPRGPVVVSMPLHRCTPPMVESLKSVLREHPGTTEVHLRLESPGRNTMMRLDDGLRVTASPSLMADLKALLGPNCVS
jgi:DNA polymerase III subunit alpha